MPISTEQVTGDQAERLLSGSENHFLDMKARAIDPAKLTKTMSAFANADGGELLVGLAEHDGAFKWDGFANEEAANGHIQALERMFPLGADASYEFLSCAAEGYDGLVLRAEIRRTPDVKLASDGKPYVRRGAQSLPADKTRLEYDKGVSSFEAQTLDAPLEVVTDSFAITGFILDVVPDVSPEPWLRKQMLIRDDRPTVASVLIFADEPQTVLPKQSAIKLYRYTTTDEVGSRANLHGQPLTIEGNAYEQIREAVLKTQEMVESIRMLDPKGGGLVDVEYPPETLHEITTNAILHRDYSIADDIHIRVFDNRIEVESPGRLAGHVTEDNILDERFSRNGQIVRWLNKFPDPPNKDVGEGLRTAFDAMRALQLHPPSIDNRAHSVLISIKHEKLASPEELILDYLSENDEISNRVVRDLTGIGSENRVKRIFQKLMEAGEIERIPDRSLAQTGYRIPAK